MNKNYQKLAVWQKAMDLAVEVYRLCKKMPKTETQELQDQIMQAAISILSNISEGQSHGAKEFIRFLEIARGVTARLESLLLLCVYLNFLTDSDIESAMASFEEVRKMTTA